MKPRRISNPREMAEVFDHAVGERALAVLSYWHGQEWVTFKGRFLERDANRRFLVLDIQEQDAAAAPPSLGQYLGLSFRYRSRKVMFTTVLEARGRFVVDSSTSIAAFRYRWPESMTELQRRAYYRTPVPEGVTLVASLWAGGTDARQRAQSESLSVVSGSAVDLSCGGTLIRVNQLTPPAWQDNETLGVELHLPDGRPPMILDAHYRGCRADESGAQCVAVQFVGLDANEGGGENLQRLARSLQKFHRLTLSPELRTGAVRFNLG